MTPDIAAEAAVWVARLHGPERSGRMERDCVAWQATSEARRLAFERCTDTWQDVALVTVRTYAAASAGDSRLSRPERLSVMARWAFSAAGVALSGVLLIALKGWGDVERYSAGVGERRVVMLSDGSRLSLNTDTRVNVDFSSTQRKVAVDQGEALFEVAKDAARPFVVRAGGSEVVALGTVFSVRLSAPSRDVGDALEVSLVEGHIALRAAVGAPDGLAPAQSVALAAGDRVRLIHAAGASGAAVLARDRPRIDQLIAWQRGEAVFEDVALAHAVADMNRYSRRPTMLAESVEAKGLRVSGLFQTGDSVEFARAVAALHGLAVREFPDRLELLPK